MDNDSIACPACGADMDPLGCEKTTACPDCGCEWAWADSMEGLREVEGGDDTYLDR